MRVRVSLRRLALRHARREDEEEGNLLLRLHRSRRDHRGVVDGSHLRRHDAASICPMAVVVWAVSMVNSAHTPAAARGCRHIRRSASPPSTGAASCAWRGGGPLWSA